MENEKRTYSFNFKPYLTFRQKQCLGLISEGKTCAAIALELKISVRTVRAHLHNAKIILGALSTTQAAVIANRMELLE
ncbi:MAG: helix-turn-helix transcriptional regulator [Anaerolineaceae bacterium]|nr:helix-turn-helix transcriptional regulator [Anaerolineaceae bacterium]